MTSRCDIHSTRWTRRLGVLAATAVLMVGGVAGCSDDDGDAKSTDTTRPGGNGQVIGSGDKYEATIRRASGGVPHISGDSIDDVAFGQGYASGEDRTCDLADQLVKIRGERSKWYGAGEDDANLNSDIAWRAIGTDRSTSGGGMLVANQIGRASCRERV